MAIDSMVSEHLDTKPGIHPVPSLENVMLMLEKCRPPGRSNNRRAMERAVLGVLKSRVPVSLGEVEGLFHSLVLPWW